MGWYEYGTTTNPIETPTAFGLFVDNENTGKEILGNFPFFRYVGSDVGNNGILNGNKGNEY